ncbi:Hypothetical predicted protein [Olea europaea subsp. europaea]|uniref:Multidrug resistance protein ABC transporter family protein n=1 Tax=Olea europaea subsp. europaea TaxID=158383 RepID=A0A8S0VKR8_OLEEU|nr:Hypothetical predicted protein [Olea europaea subsp. europaea]
MGNSIPKNWSNATGKVILSTGEVYKYDEPITVAELMLEHPQQVVVEFQPVMNGKKPTPLPADKKLETKKVYIMLPIKRGKPVALSSEEARRVLENANSFLKSKSLIYSSGFLPFFVRICPAGGGMGHDDVFTNIKKKSLVERKEEEESKSDYFNVILEGRPEFLRRQLSGKGWKPSLDTIKEKTIKAKIHHWLF